VPTAEPIGAARSNGHGHEASGALRIVLVDDHAEVRNAFRELLNRQPQFSVVGEGSNGFEAIAQAHTLRPDVILMDISMPHMDGIEATMRIRSMLPDIQIFALSMQPRSAAGKAIEQAGAAGYFVKGTDMSRLLERLTVVHASRSSTNAAGRQGDSFLESVH
jgi:DNA-binding NarL/FixJ family response regulator